jgi:hypothetical protein
LCHNHKVNIGYDDEYAKNWDVFGEGADVMVEKTGSAEVKPSRPEYTNKATSLYLTPYIFDNPWYLTVICIDIIYF